MTTPPPVSQDRLPPRSPPEYEYRTVLGGTNAAGVMLWPGQHPGRAVIRRLVTYGEWEPVTPDHWAPESPEQRLETVRALTERLLALSREECVWKIALALKQLSAGTITSRQAQAQADL